MKKLSNELLSILASLMNYDGLPANQISNVTSIPLKEIRPMLLVLAETGYLRIERYAAHNYYCANKERIIFENLPLSDVSKNLKSPVIKVDYKIKLARTCYGHLAGELGVKFTNHLFSRDFISRKTQRITEKGFDKFISFGLAKSIVNVSNVSQCLDWTERHYHLSGVLGKSITHYFLKNEWLKALPKSRAIELTYIGRRNFAEEFDFIFSNQ